MTVAAARHSVHSTSLAQAPPAPKRLAGLLPASWFGWPNAAILLLALVLRIVGLTWGFPHSFHVDEAHVIYLTDQLAQRFLDNGSLHPQASSYGALPFYLLALAAAAAEQLLAWLELLLPLPFDSAPILYVARLGAALASAATVGLTMQLTTRLFDAHAARWAGLLLAVSLLPVREAHFGAVDSLQVAFILITLLLAARPGPPTYHNFILIGLAAALALSVKVGAFLVVFPILCAFLARLPAPAAPITRVRRLATIVAHSGPLLAGGLTAVLVWLAINPYAVLDPAAYFDLDRNDSLRTQSLVVSGSLRVLYTLQFEGTPAFLYVVTNWLRYGLGLPLTALTLAGVGYSAWRLWTQRSSGARAGQPRAWFADAFVLTWLLAFGLFAGGSFAKFIRYGLPIIPPLCILGGRLLARLWSGRLSPAWPASPRAWLRPATRLLLGGLVGAALLHTLAFLSIYLQPDTRLRAAAWIQQNIRPGASILVEKDEGLLLHKAELEYGLTGFDWRIWSPYEVDGVDSVRYQAPIVSAARTQDYLDRLLTSDYIIIGDSWADRFAAAAAQYPAQAAFYARLFDGRAGYRLTETIRPIPQFGPFTWDDRGAELTFRLFDHPAVYVFERE